MFARQRMRSKKRGDLLRKELTETVDHARRAAGYAAEGVGAAVTPKVVTARETVAPKLREAANRGWGSTVEAFTPLSEAAQARLSEAGKNGKSAKSGKSSRKKKRSRRRWPAVGLLVMGVVTGAVAAAVLRQRREWEEQQLRELAEEADREQPPDFSQGGSTSPQERSTS